MPYKLSILKTKVLNSQDVRELKDYEFQDILNHIKKDILPSINDKSTMGHDLLNLFFTTFNKYVGKTDKNQAFTPDHIVHFMCRVTGVNRNSIVLDQRTPIMIQILSSIFERNPFISMEIYPFLNFKRFREGYFLCLYLRKVRSVALYFNSEIFIRY